MALAFFSGMIFTCDVDPSRWSRMLTICTIRLTLADVSVITIALAPALAVTSASVPISGVRSCRSFTASTLWTGMTCVISSSFASTASGSAPKCTGRFPFFAFSRATMRSVLPSWTAARPSPLSAALSSSTAWAGVSGWRLITVTLALTGASPHDGEAGVPRQVFQDGVQRRVAEVQPDLCRRGLRGLRVGRLRRSLSEGRSGRLPRRSPRRGGGCRGGR